MESKIIYTGKTTLSEIIENAKYAKRLVYGYNTCWWKLGNPAYTHPKTNLPCGPRGEMLLETDDPKAFIKSAMDNPQHYGKHELKAFLAAYHGNIILADKGFPTSFITWDEYNNLLDKYDLFSWERQIIHKWNRS